VEGGDTLPEHEGHVGEAAEDGDLVEEELLVVTHTAVLRDQRRKHRHRDPYRRWWNQKQEIRNALAHMGNPERTSGEGRKFNLLVVITPRLFQTSSWFVLPDLSKT